MSEKIKMPPAVQVACDKVVAATLADAPPPDEDLKVLQEWLEVDGWELIADWPGEILLTNLQYLSFFFEDDWVTSEFLDWVPDEDIDVENITDEDRLKCGRYICTAVSEAKLEYKEDLIATAHFVELTATRGENAFIVCVLLFMGQGGFEVEWHGTWKDRQAFDEYLPTVDRYCLLGQTDQLSDERILSMWSHPSVSQTYEPTIIAQRENSSMASAWQEFLSLTEGDDKEYKLFTGQYEALASKYDFFDEETGDYELPDEIDGKEVTGIDDEYVVGGELECFDDSQSVEFDDAEDPALAQWLTQSGWSRHVSVEVVKKAVDSPP
jgi:hypothetical protein